MRSIIPTLVTASVFASMLSCVTINPADYHNPGEELTSEGEQVLILKKATLAQCDLRGEFRASARGESVKEAAKLAITVARNFTAKRGNNVVAFTRVKRPAKVAGESYLNMTFERYQCSESALSSLLRLDTGDTDRSTREVQAQT